MLKKNVRGQFLAEFVLSLTIWSVFFGGLLTLVQAAVARQRAQSLARLGAFLFSTGRFTEEEVNAELQRTIARYSSSRNIHWNFLVGRYQETAASRFYRLVQIQAQADVPGFPLPLSEKMVVQQEEPSS